MPAHKDTLCFAPCCVAVGLRINGICSHNGTCCIAQPSLMMHVASQRLAVLSMAHHGVCHVKQSDCNRAYLMCLITGYAALQAELDDLSAERICAFFLYSDGSEVARGGRKFRSVTIFLAQPPLEEIRRKGNFRHLCFLESIAGEDLGLDMSIAANVDMCASGLSRTDFCSLPKSEPHTMALCIFMQDIPDVC